MSRLEYLVQLASDISQRQQFLRQHPDQIAGFDQMKAELAITAADMEITADDLELVSLGIVIGATALDMCLEGAVQHASERAIAEKLPHLDVVSPDPITVSIQVILGLSETLAPEDIPPT